MSLPSFPDLDKMPTREEVINLIISSIAMEELGLSHIINAEGEKLQFALGTIPGVSGPEHPLTMDELIELNKSIQKTLDSTMMNQFFLKEKLIGALSAEVMQGPTGPTGPQGPASIAVNTEVDRLEPDEEPYARNIGPSDQEVVLQFGIPRGFTGATGPVGTILDSYETLDQLIAAHPSGNQGDAYLVGGDIYIWNVENADWESSGRLQGPTGPTGAAGASILDAYDDYDQFILEHPDGTKGDAYLVAGELYVWNEDDNSWKNMGSLIGPEGPMGPAGAGIEILDSYDTVDELRAAHSTGSPGEVYAVDGVLYYWNDNTPDWEPIENLHGPTGPTGPAGPTGDTGPTGTLAPEQDLFTIAHGTESEGLEYEDILTLESDTMDISVGAGQSGPVITIENPAAKAGAIIPFSSGKPLTVNTDGATGGRNLCAILGFGYGSTITLTPDVSQSITLTPSLTSEHYITVPMPVNGKITSMTLTCGAYPPGGFSSYPNIITARLYISDTPDHVFRPIENATVEIEIVGAISGTPYYYGINNTLSVEVAAGSRILYLIDDQTPTYTLQTLIAAHWCGSIKIEEA